MTDKEKKNEQQKMEDQTRIEIEREEKAKEQEAAADNPENTEEEKLDAEERIAELEQENDRLKDQLLRKVAEFDNYKRRTDIEQSNFVKYAGEAVIAKLLPVYDDIRRSVEHAESKNSDSLKKGIELVFEKFTRILKDIGVEKIEAKGKEFDFNLHEALMQKEVEGVPAHTVVEEVEPGYMYKDKVIRHAKVIVSQEASSE